MCSLFPSYFFLLIFSLCILFFDYPFFFSYASFFSHFYFFISLLTLSIHFFFSYLLLSLYLFSYLSPLTHILCTQYLWYLKNLGSNAPSWEPISGTSPSRGSKSHCPAETDPADSSCWAPLGSAQCRPPQGNVCWELCCGAAGPCPALPCPCKGPLPRATHTQAALSLAPEASLCLLWPERPSSATNS